MDHYLGQCITAMLWNKSQQYWNQFRLRLWLMPDLSGIYHNWIEEFGLHYLQMRCCCCFSESGTFHKINTTESVGKTKFDLIWNPCQKRISNRHKICTKYEVSIYPYKQNALIQIQKEKIIRNCWTHKKKFLTAYKYVQKYINKNKNQLLCISQNSNKYYAHIIRKSLITVFLAIFLCQITIILSVFIFIQTEMNEPMAFYGPSMVN